jgi:hypothetical protein
MYVCSIIKKEGEERIGFGQDWVWNGAHPTRTLTFQRLIGWKEAGNRPVYPTSL